MAETEVAASTAASTRVMIFIVHFLCVLKGNLSFARAESVQAHRPPGPCFVGVQPKAVKFRVLLLRVGPWGDNRGWVFRPD